MIITNETLKHFINIDSISWEKLVITLSSIGLEVEQESKLSVPQKVVVAKILKKTQHPNADKLNVCEVDNGTEILQIVCGAKNVYVGQFVALALIDSILPFGKDGETTIQKSEIRGVQSYGMLCSSTELGLPKLNDGILELDSSIGELKLGKELREYPIFNQSILELSITPNRGDCLSVLGIARDIASFFGLILKNIVASEPSVALGVGRFLQVVPHGDLHASLLYRIVEVKKAYTPLNIALMLGIIGKYQDDVMINFMEYATYMTGVLFNVYPMDSKRISQNSQDSRLIIKHDENGLESVYSEVHDENGSTMLYKLNEIGANFHIPDKHDYPRILILEASFIDSAYLANKLYTHDKSKLNANTIHLATRGTNPDLDLGMNFLCKTLDYLPINLYSGVQEIIRASEPTHIHMTFQYISECIGNEIAKEEIALILKRLNFRIQATCDENFFIAQPPIFRNDITNRQDIVEEVLRLYGVDKIKPRVHEIKQTSQTTKAYILHQQIKQLRTKALGQGFIECIHYVFDNSKILKDLGFEPINEDKALLNPITSELDTLRPSLLPHMLETIEKNKRYGYESMRLFEIGYVYDSDRHAHLKLAFVMNDYILNAGYPNPKGVELDFFAFAQHVSEIIGAFECANIASHFIKNNLIHPYQSGNMMKNGEIIGIISRLHPNIAKKYDVNSVFFCEIDLGILLSQNNQEKMAKNFSKYQANKRDLTLILDKNISFHAIKSELENSNLAFVKQILPLDVFSENMEKNALSIRFILQSDKNTLTESQMQDTLQQALNLLQTKFNAVLKGEM